MLALACVAALAADSTCWAIGCRAYNASQACQCSTTCVNHGDCCNDYVEVCGGTGGHKATACSTAPTNKGDRRTDKSRFRFVSLNLEWMFLRWANAVGGIACPGDGCDWSNSVMATEHLNFMAGAIASLNPDAVAVQEVSDCTALSALASAITARGVSGLVPYCQVGQDSGTGQNAGFLLKVDPLYDIFRSNESVAYPVAGSVCPSALRGGAKRGKGGRRQVREGASKQCGKHAVARLPPLAPGLPPVTLIALHLLAYPDDVTRCPEREAQAQVVANVAAAARARGEEVVIGGDFNDFSATVPDSKSSRPISGVLSIIQTRSGSNALELMDARIPQAERYSNWWDRNGDCVDKGGDEHSLLDHVLVSGTAAGWVTGAFVAHSAYNQSCPSDGFRGSDHWPYVVDFAVNGRR